MIRPQKGGGVERPRSRQSLLLMTSVLTTVGVAWSAHSAATEAAPTETTQIQEVVVTAQRRSTNLIETPVAVSSISGAAMETRELRTLSDLSTETPGVQFGAIRTTGYITIRGIGNSATNQGSDPGVAFHLDGVYLGATGLAGSTFLDVDHVEILRGPQGTLFGRNATGGAVNVISKAPTDHFEAEAGVTVGVDPTQVHADGYVSGPLTSDGVILARLSARRDYNDGFTKNALAGGPGPLDDQDASALRGQLEAKPNDRFTARLIVDYDHLRDNGPAVFLLGAPGVTSSGGYMTLSPAAIAAADAAQYGAASATTGDINTRTAQANEAGQSGEFFGVRGSFEWRMDQGTLKFLAAYDHVRFFDNEDGDGTNIDYSNTLQKDRSHQYYAELVYSSNTLGRFDYLVGANVFDQHGYEIVIVPVSYFHASVILPSNLDTLSYAGFAHGNFHLTSQARLFAGVRYTQDSKTLEESNDFINGGLPITQSASWGRFTYEVGGDYEVSNTVNAYAKYSTGFKAGGFSAGSETLPFNPETNDSVEVGLKGLYFHRRLEADLTAFHMSYDNLQVNQVRGLASFTANAATARVNGVEAEFIALLTPDLRAELTATYLDAKFTEFLTGDSARPSLGTLSLAGNDLPNSPKYAYSAGLYYTLPVHVHGSFNVSGRYYWKDHFYFSEFNLPVASQAAVGRVDLGLNYVSEDKAWQAGLYARNVTNERVLNSVQVVSAVLNSAALGRLDPGREVGISLRRHF